MSYKLNLHILSEPVKKVADGDVTVENLSAAVLYFALVAILAGIIFKESEDLNASSDKSLMLACGNFSLMNFWMALLPCSKTGIFSAMVGVPFERRIRYHKGFVALAMISGLVHLLLSRNLNGNGIISSFDVVGSKEVVPVYGFMSFILFSSMSLLVFEPVSTVHFIN